MFERTSRKIVYLIRFGMRYLHHYEYIKPSGVYNFQFIPYRNHALQIKKVNKLKSILHLIENGINDKSKSSFYPYEKIEDVTIEMYKLPSRTYKNLFEFEPLKTYKLITYLFNLKLNLFN